MKGLSFIPYMAQASMRDVDPKTNTRRVIVPQPNAEAVALNYFRSNEWHANAPSAEIAGLTLHFGEHTCEYQVGERRCLLTTWAIAKRYDEFPPTVAADLIIYSKTDDRFWHAGGYLSKPEWAGKSRPGRFLPNSLRHLMPVFEVVAVRAERVQDITEAGAKAEGVDFLREIPDADETITDKQLFEILWDHINAQRGF